MHTYKRWGPTAHKVFLGFCLLTNVLVTAMLLLGGAATITAMTGGHASDGLGRADQSKFERLINLYYSPQRLGMSVHAAAFLIPLGIITCT